MIFGILGHPNILSTHKNTIEFTKDKALTKNGDCILGVKADFDLIKLKKIVNKSSRIKITLEVDNLKEDIIAFTNKKFNDEHEIVIRKSDFISKRTLGIKADKAAVDINREIVQRLRNPSTTGKVIITGI